jgi:hypothetical protein
LYQHSSLVNPVRIYIVDIVYLSKLESSHRRSVDFGWEADRVLSEFCSWQTEYRREVGIQHKVDAAILLTK